MTLLCKAFDLPLLSVYCFFLTFYKSDWQIIEFKQQRELHKFDNHAEDDLYAVSFVVSNNKT
jgi:hypothetical protein